MAGERRTHPETTFPMAQKRGRVLYRTPPATRYTPLLVVFLILSLALIDYHPIFIGLSVLLIFLGAANLLFFADKGFTVYEKGILIPISWFRNKLYQRENITYRRFVPFTRIEFFYPCSFKIYRDIIVPYGLTIKTPDFEYHLPHEYARILSKKLRVALKDEFDRLYKADYCIYRTAGDWKDVDRQFSEYSSILVRTILAFLVLFIAITAIAIGFAHVADYPYQTLEPLLQALILIDSAILSAFIVSKLKPGMLRNFYHATFRTWIALQKGEKVPEDIHRSYRKTVKRRISREADVLEIFALDRSERMSRSVVLNLVVLVQIMLIFSVTPPEFFFGTETDYSDSLREFPYEPLIITEDRVFEDTVLYLNEIVSGDHSVTIRNSTIWALGGPLFDIGPQGSIHAENSQFLNPSYFQTFRSSGTQNADHTLTRDVNIPEGARLEFYSRYEMDYGFDFGYVSISSDGENWTRLRGDHTTDARNKDAEVGFGRSHAFTGTSDWIHESIPLEGYEGSMKIRFHHLTDDHRYRDDGEWLISQVRIVWEDGNESLSRDGNWDIHGWGVGFYTPNEFWMNLEGQGEFVNCSFRSHSVDEENTEILIIDSTRVSFTDCSFSKESGPVIRSTNSNLDLRGVFLNAPEDFTLLDTEITIADSEIHASDILTNFFDSYLIVENSTFWQFEYQIDPTDIPTSGTSGILTWKVVVATVHASRSDGTNASGTTVILEPMHGGKIVSGTADESGNFTAPLFSGYQFTGTNTPRKFFDGHLLMRSDVYRITVGNNTYFKFIGDDSSFSMAAGDAPDLTPILSSFEYAYPEDGNLTNLSVGVDITNKGILDAENVTVLWTFLDSQYENAYNVTTTNLSIPAGESISLNSTGPESSYVFVDIDPNGTVREIDEENNQLYVRFNPSSSLYPRMYAYGDHVVDDIRTNMSLTTYGDLVCIGGDMDFSNEKNYTRSLTVYGDLFLENVTCLSSGSVSLDIRPARDAYVYGSDLANSSLNPGKMTIVRDCTIDYLQPYSNSQLSLTRSSVGRVICHGTSSFILIGTSTIGSMSIKSPNALIHDNVLIAGSGSPGITQSGYMLYLEDNHFSGYEEGFRFQGKNVRVRNNVFQDCQLAVTIDYDHSLPLIEDILTHNIFTDCPARLEYYHDITIIILASNGRYLASELQTLVRQDKLEDSEVHVTIENDTSVVFEEIGESNSLIRPRLLQFIVTSNGSYAYPEYHLSIQKSEYGYHYSTFSNVGTKISVVVEQQGDGVLNDIWLEPLDDQSILLNVSVTSIGLNITDLRVAVFRDQTEIATLSFPKVSSDTPFYKYITLPIAPGTFILTAGIISDDPFPGNNELSRRVQMVTTDETITARSMNGSIVIASGADVQIADGTLEFLQERDNQHEILVLGGGSLLLSDVTVQSDRPYVLRNYGELRIIDSRLVRPGSEFSTLLEDGIYFQDSREVVSEGRDPFELKLDSGIFNYGTLDIEDSRIEEGRIYSRDALSLINTTLSGINNPIGYPDDFISMYEHPHPAIFAMGEVSLQRSNISYYHQGLYLYRSDFEIHDSVFSNSIPLASNLSQGQNWAMTTGGLFVLESQGSMTGSHLQDAGIDIRNSTVNIQNNLFTSDTFFSQYQFIMRNSGGIYTGNTNLFNMSLFFDDASLLILKNCSGLTVDGNTFEGGGRGIGLTTYFTAPTVTNNAISNFTHGIRSHGDEFDHATNTFTRITGTEYSQWYELTLVPDDGSFHAIDNVDITLYKKDGRVERFQNEKADALYYNDYLNERDITSTRNHIITWLESYAVDNGTRTDNEGHNFTVSRGSGTKMQSRNVTVLMDGNMEKRAVLPLPELGVNMRVIPDDFMMEQNEELLFTVYNNGSLDAENIRVDIMITGERVYHTIGDIHINSLEANSSMDLSYSWLVERDVFTVQYTVTYYGYEASTQDNTYRIVLTAQEPPEEDTTRDTTYRGLTLLFVILSLIVLGSVYLKKQSKERTDAQGINFDVDEFRRSLKAVGSATGTGRDAGDAGVGSVGETRDSTVGSSGKTRYAGEDPAGDRSDDGHGKRRPSVPPPAPGSKPPPPYAFRVRIPGKDICPECRTALRPPDDRGMVSCFSCGWMRYAKSLERSDGPGDRGSEERQG